MKHFAITPSKCINCHNCEMACAFRFSEGKLPLSGRAIKVEVAAERNLPLTCLQCEEAACVKVCPARAIIRNEVTGALEVYADRCIGCQQCVAVCPFGHIGMDARRGIALKCDLCYGNPTCAMFCPTKALEYR
jgi:anaerobic carbon-monoxide dehydrogenase iron sulfur subunit